MKNETISYREWAAIWIGLFIAGFLSIMFADAIPPAVHANRVNQHHIASKSIEPVIGYSAYQQFVAANQ